MLDNLRQASLGEVAYFEMGQSPFSAYVLENESNGLPFLQGNAEFGAIHPTPTKYCSSPQKLCEPGDVLISVRAPVGALNKADRTYVIGRGLAAIRFTEIPPEFGWHLLNYWAENLNTVAQGSTFEAINKVNLYNLQVLLPPLPEQRRIAAILDAADEAIRATERVIAKLRQIKAGLLRDLLTRGLDAQGCLRDPHVHPEQFKNSPLGKIPREWEVIKCEQVCREIVVGIVIKPAQYYVPQGVPALRSSNVHEDKISLGDLVFISEKSNLQLSKSMLHSGDVVTVRTGYPGTSCVIPPSLDGVNCIDLIISRPGPDIVSGFLAAWINSDFGKGQVLQAQGGLAQQHFNVGALKKLAIVLPQVEEQLRVLTILDAHDARLRAEEAAVAKLRQVKRGLMDDLLTGRVRCHPEVPLHAAEQSALARRD